MRGEDLGLGESIPQRAARLRREAQAVAAAKAARAAEARRLGAQLAQNTVQVGQAAVEVAQAVASKDPARIEIAQNKLDVMSAAGGMIAQDLARVMPPQKAQAAANAAAAGNAAAVEAITGCTLWDKIKAAFGFPANCQ